MLYKNIHYLDIKNSFNVRDLGGYKSKNGKKLKSNKIIRSATLYDLNSHDLDYLYNYGVRLDVDLRSVEEQKIMPDHIPLNSKYFSEPVFSSSETIENKLKILKSNINSGFNYMMQSYKDMVISNSAHLAYRSFFDILLSNSDPQKALLFHCTTGKDRTGMAAIYLMSALDIPFDIIHKDYLASNYFIFNSKFLNKKLEKFYENSNDILRHNLKSMLEVSDVYLNISLSIIKDNYGSILNYLEKALNLTKLQRNDLKKIYLE